MSDYATRIRTVELDGRAMRIRSLADGQQFADPDRRAAGADIGSAQWSHFGQVWASGRRLANALHRYPLAGCRILEIGCGLGLPSLVAQRRGLDITASDHHPLAEVFLAYNAALNDLPAPRFRAVDWREPPASLGRYDVILGSDILYERAQVAHVAAIVAAHAHADALVLVADPRRGHVGALTRALAALAFEASEDAGVDEDTGAAPLHPRLLAFRRRSAIAQEARA